VCFAKANPNRINVASIATTVEGDALARLGEQREHVDLHSIVTEQGLVQDDLAQRQHLAAVA
jgi:hypothetical protein